MKKIYITGDFNDADYGKALIEIDEVIFEKFLPFIEAINNFQPYIRRDSIGGIDYHNFVSYREDLGEMTVYEKYPQFDMEYINEFMNIFVNPIPVPQPVIPQPIMTNQMQSPEPMGQMPIYNQNTNMQGNNNFSLKFLI